MKLLSLALPYLLLVSFYSGEIEKFDSKKIDASNDTPYTGIAVPLLNAYSSSLLEEDNLKNTAIKIKKATNKHIWPWIFFNRVVGYKKDERSASIAGNQEYFRKIKGLDIYNESGAMSDFLLIWKLALRTAKDLGSPGIVIDPETYNNYKYGRVRNLASAIMKSEEEVKERLQQVGKILADITAAEYPEAILWFLYTGLGDTSGAWKNSVQFQYPTIKYIIEGLLEAGKDRKADFKIVSGGELSLGYCYETLLDMRLRVASRQVKFGDALSRFNNLALGGTIAPWKDASLKNGSYFTRNVCGSSKMQNLDDFQPLFRHLFKSYQFVWIYGAAGAGYDPYSAEDSASYNSALRQALAGCTQEKQ